MARREEHPPDHARSDGGWPPPPTEQRPVASAPPPRRRHRWFWGLVAGLTFFAIIISFAVLVVLVLSGTDWGRERVRRFAENAINGAIHGRVRIGHLSGNLLVGLTAHDIAISDTAGKPFITAEAVRGDYSLLSLLRKRIWIRNTTVVRPVVTLDRPPDGKWNFKTIFRFKERPPSQGPGWGDWVSFTNTTIVDGQLIVRSPWHARSSLRGAARDSAERFALSGKDRLLVERVGKGFQKVVRLDSITMTVPMLMITEPGLNHPFAQITSGSLRAFPFRPPPALVRDMKGVVAFNSDSAWWKNAYAALPSSKATGSGIYDFNTGDLHVNLRADPVHLADVLWVYPRFPREARGKFNMRLAWVGPLSDYQFTNADVRLRDAHATGTLGVTFDDTTRLHNTDVRFSSVETSTLEQLIPDFQSPRHGVLSGRASVEGTIHALDVDGDVTFDDVKAGRSRVIAAGRVAFPRGSVRATNLRVQMLPVRVDMARTWMPSLPLGGDLTGTVTLNGASNHQLTAVGSIEHQDRGERSALQGSATVRIAGAPWFDIDVIARPVSLVEVGRFFPSMGLHGSAVGPVHVTGSLSNLRAVADLRLPDGGRLTTRGTFDVASKEKGYDFTAQLYALNLRSVDRRAPATALTAHLKATGRGFDPRTMRATIDADFATSRWDTIGVDTATVRAGFANGLVDVRRLYVAGTHATASASGSFGITRERTGTLTYRVVVDSLGTLNRWIPRSAMAKAPVAPRPRATARAIQRAKADSARIDRATEMQRLLSGRPGPKLAVRAPRPVPHDTLSGAARTEGTIRGNIYQFDLRGRASGENVVVRGNYFHHFASEYAWMDARTPNAKVAVGVDADSVSIMGFAFDTVNTRATYTPSGGRVELVVVEDEHREYSLKGDYALFPNRDEARLTNLTFRFDTAFWTLARPASFRWGPTGYVVSDLELRDRGNGRIYANGVLPTEGTAKFTLDVSEFPLSHLSEILQTSLDVKGDLTLHGTLNGTMRAPLFRGTFAVTNGRYNKTVVPELTGRIGYAEREIVGHVELARKNGRQMATVDGRVPINLAITGVTGSRIPNEEMSVELVADSLPVELIPEFTDLVSNVHGRAGGRLSLRGTVKHPVLTGGFAVSRGTVTLAATGATIDKIYGSAHVSGDTLYVDSIAGNAKGPVRLRGALVVADWREPTFDLHLTSSNAELLHNDHGKLHVDARLALTGPFRSASLSGDVTIAQGVVYIPEGAGQHVVGPGDPSLFYVLDTAITTERELFPPVSPFLAHLRADVTLSIRHDTWVRNREANIEIFTEEPLHVHREQQSLALTGVLLSERGEYSFLSKRFQIKRGSATFVGGPEIDPTLELTGEYTVELPSRGALDITVIIGGTLQNPTLALESDAQPPRTQSELLTLLVFGGSSTALLATGTSSIAGSAATSDLFGVGAQVAARRLAGVALGVAASQLQYEAVRSLGTDVFEITPTDAPSGNILGNLFTQTRIEAGKYVNPRTFVTVETQAFQPGAGIEHRTPNGWLFNASISSRLLLTEPTLTSQPYRVVQTYGGFIVREWRF